MTIGGKNKLPKFFGFLLRINKQLFISIFFFFDLSGFMGYFRNENENPAAYWKLFFFFEHDLHKTVSVHETKWKTYWNRMKMQMIELN